MDYFLRCWWILSVSAGLWANTSGQFFGGWFPFFGWPNPLAFWAAGGAGVGAQIPDIGLAGNQDDIRQFWPSFRSLQERAETKPANSTAAAIANSTAAALANSTAAAISPAVANLPDSKSANVTGNATAAAISPAIADLPAKVAGNATASSSTNSTSDDTAKAPSRPRSIANHVAGNALSLPAPDHRPSSVVQQRQVLSLSLTALEQEAASTVKPEEATAETAVTKLIPKRPKKRTTKKQEPLNAV